MSSTLTAIAAATANAADVKKPKTLCTRTTVECMIAFCWRSETNSSTAFGCICVAVVNK